MSLDLTKLSPAPWDVVATMMRDAYKVVRRGRNEHGGFDETAECDIEADADFIALARIAFDVMMRRGWNPVNLANGWAVEDGGMESYIYRSKKHGGDGSRVQASDPFTALVEADRWYAANVENKPV